jgi:hypothetical protein
MEEMDRNASAAAVLCRGVCEPQSLEEQQEEHEDAVAAAAASSSTTPAVEETAAPLVLPTNLGSVMTSTQREVLRSQVQLHLQLLYQSLWLTAVVPTPPPNRATAYKPRVPHAQLHTQCRELLHGLESAATGTASPISPPPAAAAAASERASALALLDFASASMPASLTRGLGAPASAFGSPDPSTAAAAVRKRRKSRATKSPLAGEEEEEATSSVTPYSLHRALVVPEGVALSALRVPALAMWREDDELRHMQPGMGVLFSAEAEAERQQQQAADDAAAAAAASSSAVSSMPVVATFKRDPESKRHVLTLPQSAVDSFWLPRYNLARFGLDRKFRLRLQVHERHLFSAAEEHLWRRGIEVLLRGVGRSIPSTVAAQGNEEEERKQVALLAHLRRRFLPGKTLAQLRTRLVKEEMSPADKKAGGAKKKSPAATAAITAASGKKGRGGAARALVMPPREALPMASPATAQTFASGEEAVSAFPLLEAPTAGIDAGAAAAAASAPSSPSFSTATIGAGAGAAGFSPAAALVASSAERGSDAALSQARAEVATLAPVVLLRDFRPSELLLAAAGWAAHGQATKDKWSLISANFLPHWPRKLLAKAWTKHTERLKGKQAARKRNNVPEALAADAVVETSAVAAAAAAGAPLAFDAMDVDEVEEMSQLL